MLNIMYMCEFLVDFEGKLIFKVNGVNVLKLLMKWFFVVLVFRR